MVSGQADWLGPIVATIVSVLSWSLNGSECSGGEPLLTLPLIIVIAYRISQDLFAKNKQVVPGEVMDGGST